MRAAHLMAHIELSQRKCFRILTAMVTDVLKIKVALKTPCIRNVEFKIIKTRTGC